MDSTNQTPTLERLLAERAWLRRLAGRLVADEGLADDLEQDAFLAALEKAPADLRSPRAWLATVLRNGLRNRRRADERRQRRETSAPARTAEGTDDLVARAELVEKVGRLVLRLDEPYRTTVLLRYFEDLPPRRIAARMGVPVETVRTRLKRAMRRLADDLDADHEGNRRTWVLMLLPIAHGVPAASSIGGAGGSALAMAGSTKSVLAAVIAALLLAALVPLVGHWWTALHRESSDLATSEVVEQHAVGNSVDPATLEGRAEAGSRPGVGAADTEKAEAAHVVRGRVLRKGRHSATQARITLYADGRRFASVTSGEDGSYAVPLDDRAFSDRRVDWAVEARGDAGEAAVVSFRTHADRPPPDTLPPLLLGRAGSLVVKVRSSRVGVPPADVLVLGEGFKLRGVIRRGTTDASGEATFGGLPAQVYAVVALADGCGRYTEFVRVEPERAARVQLVLGAERPLDVRVVLGETDRPVAGVAVRVAVTVRRGTGIWHDDYDPQPEIAPTNERGFTTIPGMAEGSTFWVVARGGIDAYPVGVQASEAVGPEDTSVVIRLPVPHVTRWPIEPSDIGVPPDGTELAIVPMGGVGRGGVPVPGRVEGGHVVIDGWPGGEKLKAFARAADGQLALLESTGDEATGPATSFRAPRTLAVVGRDASGRPLAGRLVTVRGEAAVRVEPLRLDAEGRALFTGLYPGTVWLWLSMAEEGPRATETETVGKVDLEPGDAEFTITLRPTYQLDLACWLGEGPGLPDTYSISMEHAVSGIEEENAAEGKLRLRWRPTADREQYRLILTSRDHLPWSTWLKRGDEAAIVRLREAGVIAWTVHRPEDGVSRVSLQAWDSPKRAWGHLQSSTHDPALAIRTPEEETRVVSSLTTGTYRLRDRLSGVASSSVDLVPGAMHGSLALDLRSIRVLRGRVEVEGDADLTRARVRRGRPPPPSVKSRVGFFDQAVVAADGGFEVRVPRGRPTILHVWHPDLSAAKEGGWLTVTDETKDICLRLEPASGATLALEVPTPDAPRPEGLQVLFFDGRTDQEPLHRCQPTLRREGSTWIASLGTPPANATTIWIDARGYAPARLDDVDLAGVGPALGPVRLEEGSTLSVRLLVGEDDAPSITIVKVRAETHPSYRREAIGEATREIHVRGLGSGRFCVEVHVLYDVMDDTAPPVFEGVIDVDGVRPVEMEVELR